MYGKMIFTAHKSNYDGNWNSIDPFTIIPCIQNFGNLFSGFFLTSCILFWVLCFRCSLKFSKLKIFTINSDFLTQENTRERVCEKNTIVSLIFVYIEKKSTTACTRQNFM